MKIEDFFNRHNIVDLSFFNFRNAITAAYFANEALEVQKVNGNFESFFPILGNVTNIYFPHILEQLGLPGAQIEEFVENISRKGFVLIPEVHITKDGEDRVFSLLSTRTHDDAFSYLNGVQGQFVDRTEEWNLKKEREQLLEQKLHDREIIEEKSQLVILHFLLHCQNHILDKLVLGDNRRIIFRNFKEHTNTGKFR